MRNTELLVFLLFYRVSAQYGPQSNIDRLAQRPVLPQCPREWEWACRNGECIAHYDVCDGIIQCTDGSDEWNCDSARGIAPLAHEGVAPKESAPTAAAVITTTTTVSSEKSGTVTLQYSHILLALLAFVVLSVAVVVVIRKRARPKTGFRNRRGHNILQQDSDEDDILITSMYSN